MNASAPSAVARLVARATKDPDVLAVLLFGSRPRGDAAPSSDFDVCLVLGGGTTRRSRPGGEAAQVPGRGGPRRGGLPVAAASYPQPGPPGRHGPLRAGRGGPLSCSSRACAPRPMPPLTL